jgi:hypothetical protein
MDVLVVVDDAPVPERLAIRARRRVDVTAGALPTGTIADLRAHIPRSVGVIGIATEAGTVRAADVARQLHGAGLPVTIYTDLLGDAGPGVETSRITDPGPPMDVSNSLIELIGNTPLVRLDRIGRDLSCQLLAKLEFLNPGSSIKDRPALTMIEAAEAEGLLRRGGTDLGQHRGRTGHRGRSPRLPLHFHHARQDRHREGRPAPGVRRGGGGLSDGRRPVPPRLVLLGRSPPDRVDARRLHAQPVR